MLRKAPAALCLVVCSVLVCVYQSKAKFVSVGSIPTDSHPQTALLMWGPDSVEHNAEATQANMTAVRAYRNAYNVGDLDQAIEATYTLQAGYFSPETGLDQEGRTLYETVEEDTRNILWEDYDGLERFAALLALFPLNTQGPQKGTLQAMIKRLYNERKKKQRRDARSWTVWLKRKLRAWLGDEE
jgi:hypothetical protein